MQAIRPEIANQIANISSNYITANSGKNIYPFSIKSSILYLNSAKMLNNFFSKIQIFKVCFVDKLMHSN